MKNETQNKVPELLREKLKGYDFIQELETEIMGNVRVIIKDQRGKTLWTCNDDEWRDDLFKDMKLEVEQSLDMHYIVTKIINYLERNK